MKESKEVLPIENAVNLGTRYQADGESVSILTGDNVTCNGPILDMLPLIHIPIRR